MWSQEWNTGLAGCLVSCDLGEVNLTPNLIPSVVGEGVLCKMGVVITTLLLRADEIIVAAPCRLWTAVDTYSMDLYLVPAIRHNLTGGQLTQWTEIPVLVGISVGEDG